MLREQIYDICLDCDLKSFTDWDKEDTQSWQFIANDFSEGTFELDNFCLRFETDETAREFKNVIDDAVAGKPRCLVLAAANHVASKFRFENLADEPDQNTPTSNLPINLICLLQQNQMTMVNCNLLTLKSLNVLNSQPFSLSNGKHANEIKIF